LSRERTLAQPTSAVPDWQSYGVADAPDVVVLKMRGGELADAGSWVYVWCRAADDRRVVYVGATGLDPATRAWLHLHDPDPAIGRVSALLPSAGVDPLDMVVLRLPPGVSRPDVKVAVIARLSERGLLSTDYVGDPPPGPPADATAEVVAYAEHLTEEVAEHIADEK
jgi:hypothetical protein